MFFFILLVAFTFLRALGWYVRGDRGGSSGLAACCLFPLFQWENSPALNGIRCHFRWYRSRSFGFSPCFLLPVSCCIPECSRPCSLSKGILSHPPGSGSSSLAIPSVVLSDGAWKGRGKPHPSPSVQGGEPNPVVVVVVDTKTWIKPVGHRAFAITWNVPSRTVEILPSKNSCTKSCETSYGVPPPLVSCGPRIGIANRCLCLVQLQRCTADPPSLQTWERKRVRPIQRPSERRAKFLRGRREEMADPRDPKRGTQMCTLPAPSIHHATTRWPTCQLELHHLRHHSCQGHLCRTCRQRHHQDLHLSCKACRNPWEGRDRRGLVNAGPEKPWRM